MNSNAPAKHPCAVHPSGRGETGSLFRAVLWFALFSIPLSAADIPLCEHDTGWHLRTGQWVVEHGAAPRHDEFSTIGSEPTWIAYSWLFGVLVYGLEQSLDWFGILLYRTAFGLLIVGSLLGMVRRQTPQLAVQAGIVGAAAVALISILAAERPVLFTILFSIWTLRALLSLRAGDADWRIWLLPLVYALWANIHVQFVFGLLLLGLAGAAPMVDRILGWETPDDSAKTFLSAGWRRLCMLGVACFAATFVNPYGWRVYEVVFSYARLAEIFVLFEELGPLRFRMISDWAVLGLVLAAAFVLGLRFADRSKTCPSSFEFMILSAGCYFSFHSRHDLWLVVLTASAVLCGLPEARPGGSGRTALPPWKETCLSVLVAVVACFVWLGPHRILESRFREDQALYFPVAAADWIDKQRPPGPIFNAIDWGGYLLWRLPEYQVGIDGRAQLHGGARVKRFMDAEAGRPGWQENSDLAAAGLVVLRRASPLAELLRHDARFRTVYTDELAIVFTRK
ncbi:MAG: hypothetical protein L0Y72_12555 [Gemmataceae bacterium]|nr:hypothetical protein [Gemmataceae bacterium]MCI0739869.1 hypothetical protein [Gemmataceae bacterium]